MNHVHLFESFEAAIVVATVAETVSRFVRRVRYHGNWDGRHYLSRDVDGTTYLHTATVIF